MRRDDQHIRTERLRLVSVHAAHYDRFVAIAGHWEVARMTADIPHPLTHGDARLWFQHDENDVRFAISLNDQIIGFAGYYISRPGEAELGFFITPGYWGKGYAGEASRAIIAFGFGQGTDAPALSQFTSSHFTDNHSSARVLQKLEFLPRGFGECYCEARQTILRTQRYLLKKCPQRPEVCASAISSSLEQDTQESCSATRIRDTQ